MKRHWLLALACLLVAGCGQDRAITVVDAPAIDAPVAMADAGIGTDAPPSWGWVDFTVTGCEHPDGGQSCVGPAPLSVSLTAISPAAIDIYRWQFGDDSAEDLAPSPVHTYARPGTYDVTLTVGGPGGTATRHRTAAVTVIAAPLGAACQAGDQCESGDCMCGDGQPCPAGLDGGVCTVACTSDSDCATGVCADLAPSDPAPEPAASWQRRACLPACTSDDDCERGFRCQALVAGDGDGWISGCFAPGILVPMGGSCRDANADPDPARCAGGLCLDAGARGLCSADCSTVPCPEGAACATFAALGSVCVARCGDELSCDGDPGLACQAPADGGFSVDEAADPAGYCTPTATALTSGDRQDARAERRRRSRDTSR
ncbi:MAG TPA: PKD domain-containing protein [Kofleriaceae bacterium]|nr:PKD domain-containing protein [Kofleriaceae bacterium]